METRLVRTTVCKLLTSVSSLATLDHLVSKALRQTSIHLFLSLITLSVGYYFLCGSMLAQVPPVTISPGSLTFPVQLLKTTSVVQTIKVTNNQLVPLNITALYTTGDFSQSSDCGSTLAPSSSCTVSVSLIPAAIGNRSGTLKIEHDAVGSPTLAPLIGQGSQPIVGGVVATSRMNYARKAHTATLLNDGKVLVAGGSSGPAELYDPTTNKFTVTGYMSSFHQYHTATLLADGRVLILGGNDESYDIVASTELYDPVTGTFSNAGNMSVPRAGHTATLLSDGTVYIAGGISDWADGPALASIERYDPRTGAFVPIGNLKVTRFFHSATLLPTDRILFVGGENATGLIRKAEASWLYWWAGTTKLPRSLHTATLLNNGQVLITQGYPCSSKAAELWVPAKMNFILAKPTAQCAERQTTNLLPDGTVFVTEVRLAEVYNPDLGTLGAPVNFIYGANNDYSLTTTLLQNGLILVIGGVDGNAELYAPRFLSTTSLASSANSPSTYGQAITFAATVTASTTPTGTVIFKDGAKNMATVTLSSGIAKLTRKLAVGTHSITAHYAGDAIVGPSASAAVTQIVNQATTTTSVVSSANPSMSGAAVTFTATVTCPTCVPTGTVTFKTGSTDLGTYTLVSRKASVTTSTLPVGANTISATYNGTANIVGSIGSILQTVN